MDLKQICAVFGRASPIRLGAYLPYLNASMTEAQINTDMRVAMYVAQLGHESGEFKWLEEIWGPTPQQKKYEPPSDLANKLGNTEAGDGYRFKGRGVIQLTGRSNYARCGADIGVDLANNPSEAATPTTAFRIAAWYWNQHRLNQYADIGDIVTCTKRINGGLYGIDQRTEYYKRALTVLTNDRAPPTPTDPALES
jgi:predicted chitinase